MLFIEGKLFENLSKRKLEIFESASRTSGPQVTGQLILANLNAVPTHNG